MRLLVAIAATLLSFNAAAAVYKCKNASGAIEFKDKPCAPGTGGEIAVKGVAPADPPGHDSAASGKGSSATLSGTWCEYAVSMDEDGEKDESMPADWTFSGDTVEYRMKRGGGTIKSRIVRSESGFAIENDMLGGVNRDWEIVSQRNGELVVHGPIGGYFHFRRGACR
jgi:hypothetical protein